MSLLPLALCGCATEGKYERNMNAWLGHSEPELVSKWGIPNSTYQLLDTKYLTYISDGGTTGYVSQGFVITTAHWCKTTIQISATGIVQSLTWQGNSCRAD